MTNTAGFAILLASNYICILKVAKLNKFSSFLYQFSVIVDLIPDYNITDCI
jgi:hypothetical protein